MREGSPVARDAGAPSLWDLMAADPQMSAAVLLLAPSAACAAPTPAASGVHAIDDIRVLSADGMEGRGVGTPAATM